MASDDAVNIIVQALKEAEELPRKQIAEIVEVLGSETALGLLAETHRVQGEGGIAVRDGTRRRTDGGVFFSLAKTKLPKADRNRIFRVRPPKSPDGAASEHESDDGDERSEAPPQAAKPAPPPVARPREVVVAPRNGDPSGGAGRRRVVEVEVLRQKPKPIEAKPPEPRPAAPVDAGSRELSAPATGLRPLRRIVTVAPAVREAPPATPEAATGRIKEVLQGLGVADQRRVLLEILRGIGGLPEPEPKRVPPPPPAPPPVREEGIDDKTRERVLAAVTDALGLSTSDLARVLFDEDTAGARARARTVLERFRRS
jgi:hypothetical protein